MSYVLPFNQQVHQEPIPAQARVTVVTRFLDWLGERMEAARAAEVERYLAGAANRIELSQRLHRLEQDSHLFHV